MADNGVGAAAFVNSFMRAYGFIDEMKSRQQARESAKADDAWKQKARGRQEQDWEYVDSTRETPEEVKARRARGDELQGLQLEGAKFNLDTARGNQAYTEATRPTPEHVREVQGLQLDQARTGLAATKQSMALAGARGRRDQADWDNEQARNRVAASLDFLESPFAKQFDDPDFRAKAVQFDELFNNENSAGINASFSAQDLYDFGNKLFSRELQSGVGEQLQDGSKIVGKQLVSARRRGDKVVLELAVTAQRPDGTTYQYQAPVTKNRSSKDDDEVAEIPLADIRDRIRGAKYMAQFVDQGGSLEQARAELRRTYIELGGDPSGARGKTGAGAQQQYLKFVADNVFGGDLKAAFASIRGGNVRQIAASMAGKMAELQKNSPRSQQKPYEQLYSEAVQILQGAAGVGAGADIAADDGGDGLDTNQSPAAAGGGQAQARPPLSSFER